MPQQGKFAITHAETGKTSTRPCILLNPHYKPTKPKSSSINPEILTLQKQLPHYSETPLIPLPQVAQELGVGHVFLKDESRRFGLPSFKILGASWAVYRVLCERIGLDSLASLDELRVALRGRGLRLVTCSEGNWGRAIAYMATLLEVEVTVFLSEHSDVETRRKIGDEGRGVEVRIVKGNYDDAIVALVNEAEKTNTVLVMDTSWEGFERVPRVSADQLAVLGMII